MKWSKRLSLAWFLHVVTFSVHMMHMRVGRRFLFGLIRNPWIRFSKGDSKLLFFFWLSSGNQAAFCKSVNTMQQAPSSFWKLHLSTLGCPPSTTPPQSIALPKGMENSLPLDFSSKLSRWEPMCRNCPGMFARQHTWEHVDIAVAVH